MSKEIKSYMGKRGYILIKKYYTENFLNKIRTDLTVIPFVNKDYGQSGEYFNSYMENTNKIYLPKFYALDKFGKPDENKLSEGEDIDLKFTGNLRPNQIKPVDICLQSFREKGGGIISLPCGFGKTICALYMACEMKKKTLIIVHKEFLANQWKERIEQVLPTAKIGIIQQDKLDIEGKDFVVAMLQSLSMKEYALDTFDKFGMTIIDECHRIPCQVFSKALRKINTPFMLGLSATPNRKDGLTKVLKWYIGDIVFSIKPKDENIVNVERLFINSNNEFYQKEEFNYRGKVNMPTMISNITQNMNRTRLIIYWIKNLLSEDRKILVLSDRRQHLEDINKLCHEDNLNSVGFYVGGMKQCDLKISENKSVILGTFSMSSEALDIPGLDTLILASPKSDIVQAVGRILRKKHEEINPKIIDLVDNFSLFTSQSNKRLKFYKTRKYEIEDVKLWDEFDEDKKPFIIERYEQNYNKKIQNSKKNVKTNPDSHTNNKCLFKQK